MTWYYWLRREDSNLRPSGYENQRSSSVISIEFKKVLFCKVSEQHSFFISLYFHCFSFRLWSKKWSNYLSKSFLINLNILLIIDSLYSTGKLISCISSICSSFFELKISILYCSCFSFCFCSY